MNVYKSGHKFKDAFNKLDFDRDGYIALSELHRSLALVDVSDELSVQQQKRLSKAYRHLDDDHDGRLDYNEFVRTITKPDYSASLWQTFLYRTADIVTPGLDSERIYEKLNRTACRPPPLFFLALSAVQIACYVVFIALPYGVTWLGGCPGCYNSTGNENVVNKLVFLSNHRTEAWRYVSYAFLHSGLLHIAGNVFIQIFVGLPYEIVHRTWRVAVLYIFGILCGALLLPVLDPHMVLVGASAGCYAILTVHIINFIANWCDMNRRWSHSALLILFLGADLCAAAYRRLTPCGRVSPVGHLAGLFVGSTLGLVIFLRKLANGGSCAPSSSSSSFGGEVTYGFSSPYARRKRRTTTTSRTICWSVSAIVFIAIFTALVCLNVILPVDYQIFEESMCHNYTTITSLA